MMRAGGEHGSEDGWMLRSLVNSPGQSGRSGETVQRRSLVEVAHVIAVGATHWPRWGKQLLSAGLDFVISAAGLAVVVSAFQMLCGCYAGPLHPVVLVADCGALQLG